MSSPSRAGLSEGGFVFFNGIRVGEVTDIKLDPVNPNRVVTRVRLDGETPVRIDSRAQLEPQGITGVNYIQVSAGSPKQPLLEPRNRNDIPVIRSTPSAFAGLLEGGGTVLQRTVESLDRVNLLLSDQNLRSISASVGNVQTMTGEIAATGPSWARPAWPSRTPGPRCSRPRRRCRAWTRPPTR
jgi:phospholipid/cholesterol/gamma-HCH transport system substrate-binding protein